MKKTLIAILTVCIFIFTCIFGNEYISAKLTNKTSSKQKKPSKIVKTSVQSQPINYIKIGSVGGYNNKIITNNLLKACKLPPATASKLPYWTGYIIENKISTNYTDNRWDKYTGGTFYFVEKEIEYLAKNRFNCARVLYSFSFLGKPGDPYMINKSELEQLDELISWGLKNNVHIMISNTGLPNKRSTSWDEENVMSNPELFKNKKMQELYLSYWDMLAKRYKDIPSNVLSFELAVEANVPDGDTKLYADVLTPVAKNIWSYNPKRIVIVNDVWKQVPEQLAKIGCCISLHNHIYTVDERRLRHNYKIETDAKWPMEYLPNSFNDSSGVLTLKSESKFSKGKLILYFECTDNPFEIKADEKLISKPVFKGGKWGELTKYEVEIPKDTSTLTLTPKGGSSLIAITIKQENKPSVTLPTHGLYTCCETEPLPSIQINNDGTTKNINNPQKLLNSEYFTKQYLKKFIDTAKQYNVGFIMTEIGTDTMDLSPQEYTAYHETWLTALKNNNIGWMYNCIHNILAPQDIMWLNSTNSKFTKFEKVETIPNYYANKAITDMLKRYSK